MKKTKIVKQKPALRKGKVMVVKRIKIKAEAAPRKKSNREQMNKIWIDDLLADARVRKWLIQTVGEHAIHVIKEFACELSDEEISKRTGLRASDVRVVLNRLHSHGLANYSRNRDKNSGWYSYMWKLDDLHAIELAEGMKNLKKAEMELENVIGVEYYYCPKEGKGDRYPFEDARNLNFRCPKCEGMLQYLGTGTGNIK